MCRTSPASERGFLLLEITMFKFTTITEPMCFNIMPISVNQDGSISATVTVGFVKDNTFTQFAQQSHYLSVDEAKPVLSTIPAEGETIQDALSRSVHEALKAKGTMPF